MRRSIEACGPVLPASRREVLLLPSAAELVLSPASMRDAAELDATNDMVWNGEHWIDLRVLFAKYAASAPLRIEHAGDLVGLWVLRHSARAEAWMTTTYLAPAARRHGFGRLLKSTVLDVVRSRGERFAVSVRDRNAASHAAVRGAFPGAPSRPAPWSSTSVLYDLTDEPLPGPVDPWLRAAVAAHVASRPRDAWPEPLSLEDATDSAYAVSDAA